jgi:hypothetical protein
VPWIFRVSGAKLSRVLAAFETMATRLRSAGPVITGSGVARLRQQLTPRDQIVFDPVEWKVCCLQKWK